MEVSTFPAIPQALLERLEKSFPERSPSGDETLEQLMFRGGQTHVVRLLRAIFEDQNETVLAPEETLNVHA